MLNVSAKLLEKNKPRSAAAGAAKENKNMNRIPQNNLILPDSAHEKEREIWRILINHIGEENSISRSQLAALVGMHERALRVAIRRMRQQHGLPILSSFSATRGGYFLARNEAEFERFTRAIKSHGVSTLTTFMTAEKARQRHQAEAVQPSLLQRASEPTKPASLFDFMPKTDANDCPRCGQLRRAGSNLRCKAHAA